MPSRYTLLLLNYSKSLSTLSWPSKCRVQKIQCILHYRKMHSSWHCRPSFRGSYIESMQGVFFALIPPTALMHTDISSSLALYQTIMAKVTINNPQFAKPHNIYIQESLLRGVLQTVRLLRSSSSAYRRGLLV